LRLLRNSHTVDHLVVLSHALLKALNLRRNVHVTQRLLLRLLDFAQHQVRVGVVHALLGLVNALVNDSSCLEAVFTLGLRLWPSVDRHTWNLLEALILVVVKLLHAHRT
jgi:hypothetical protein